jgi:hypothetical protein
MKNICVIYNGGNYGTFIEWCLNYFSDLTFDETLPFTSSGDSHKFKGNNLGDFAGCVNYIQSSNNYSFVRVHPKTKIDEDIIHNLQYINRWFNKIIYINQTRNDMAWSINNKFEKIYPNRWLAHNELTILSDIQRWNVDSLDKMTIWEKREFMSLNSYPQHVSESELEKSHQIRLEFNNFHFIDLTALRDNFKNEILSLLEYCQLTAVRVDKMQYVYDHWIKCQHHCNKDQLIKVIVNSILNNNYYDWSAYNLTLVDEALIQYYLREQHIEIKCYNLNIFPTTTTKLKEYLYNV